MQPGMKRDMGGAAAVLGAFQAAVKAQITGRPLHALLCLAENSVAANATRPDDIHTLYSGRTVRGEPRRSRARCVTQPAADASFAQRQQQQKRQRRQQWRQRRACVYLGKDCRRPAERTEGQLRPSSTGAGCPRPLNAPAEKHTALLELETYGLLLLPFLFLSSG